MPSVTLGRRGRRDRRVGARPSDRTASRLGGSHGPAVLGSPPGPSRSTPRCRDGCWPRTDQPAARGQPDEVVKIPTLGLAEFPLVVVTGLGADDDRRPPMSAAGRAGAVAAAVRALPAARPGPGLPRRRRHERPGRARRGASPWAPCSAGTASPATSRRPAAALPTRRGRSRSPPPTPAPRASRALRRALAIGQAVTGARDLVNTPPNDLYPQSFAAELTELAAGLPVEVEVLDERALRPPGLPRHPRGRPRLGARAAAGPAALPPGPSARPGRAGR